MGKIQQLEPDKLSRYNQLLGRLNELDHISAQVREGEGESDHRSFKEEFNALQKRLQRLEKEEHSLIEDLQIADLEPQNAQKQLLNKVKKMNSQTTELDN